MKNTRKDVEITARTALLAGLFGSTAEKVMIDGNGTRNLRIAVFHADGSTDTIPNRMGTYNADEMVSYLEGATEVWRTLRERATSALDGEIEMRMERNGGTLEPGDITRAVSAAREDVAARGGLR